jgi:hypothetical protein
VGCSGGRQAGGPARGFEECEGLSRGVVQWAGDAAKWVRVRGWFLFKVAVIT